MAGLEKYKKIVSMAVDRHENLDEFILKLEDYLINENRIPKV
jgi:hypothetical protein